MTDWLNEVINQTVIERERSDMLRLLIYMTDAFLVFLSCKAVVHIALELMVYNQEGLPVMDMRVDVFTECFYRG